MNFLKEADLLFRKYIQCLAGALWATRDGLIVKPAPALVVEQPRGEERDSDVSEPHLHLG